jgi:hypothetical protein
MPIYKIHPGIGIARLGNSDTEFYLAPEMPAALPQECDRAGNPREYAGTPVYVSKFKDGQGRIKRQAARFRVFAYDDQSPQGKQLKLGDRIEGGGNRGKLVDIQWRVHLANKKAAWYEFDALNGEHGYKADHPRRNPSVLGNERDRLIIDPGPRIVNRNTKQRARFDRSGEGVYAPTFPPENLRPNPIDMLGDMMTNDAGDLLVLGGYGCSGSELEGPGHPRIGHYANNDGWYDDVSDGPIMARLVMQSDQDKGLRYIDVEYPAWVIVGYPRFAPQVLDVVTMDDVLYDLFARYFAYDTSIYGRLGTFDNPEVIASADQEALQHWRASRLAWNRSHRPWFFRDVWTILFRPDEFRFLTDILGKSNYPHDQELRGSFDPYKLAAIPRSRTNEEQQTAQCGERPQLSESRAQSTQPRAMQGQMPLGRPAHLMAAFRDASQGEAWLETKRRPTRRGDDEDSIEDEYGPLRNFIFEVLRRAGEENEFRLRDKVGSRVHNLPLKPLLCGDNPISNAVPSKFLRLTEYHLFILRQWANGCFIDERREKWLPPNYSPFLPYPTAAPVTGRELDRGVLSNVLGGSFCPGAEAGWVMRNPSIYWVPYRIKADRRFSDFLRSAAQANQMRAAIDDLDDFMFVTTPRLNHDNDFAVGLQPGDLTKYMALPWQADFNECSTETINITYSDWNEINPDSDNDERLSGEEKHWVTLWWPAHRPLQSYELVNGNTPWTIWTRGIPQSPSGDLKMVTEWSRLGFVIRNPDPNINLNRAADENMVKYVSVERSHGDQQA